MKKSLIGITVTAIIMLLTNFAWSGKLNEKKLIKSANKVVEQWQAVLSKPISTATFREGRDYWIAGKWFFSEKVFYDIKKTDSIVSPYKLIIKVANSFGIVPPFKQNEFKTCDEALKASNNKTISDLAGADENRELVLVYIINENNWVLADDKILNQFTCKCCPDNAVYKKLKKMPIK